MDEFLDYCRKSILDDCKRLVEIFEQDDIDLDTLEYAKEISSKLKSNITTYSLNINRLKLSNML